MMYVKEGINDDGIRFKQMEETIIYYLESETDLEKTVAKLNRQVFAACGKEWLDIKREKKRISEYPEEYVIDIYDMFEFVDENSDMDEI